MSKIELSTQFAPGRIDREKGIIFGVSVITEGDAIGHGFQIDATTLSGVKACADAFADGVRVKVNHGTGFDAIVGNLRNFAIDGKQLRADLHLILSHEKTAAILEMAEKMPGGFGLSIAFSGKHEMDGKQKLARCEELYSVDLVDFPAANPGGLFRARVDSAQTVEMNSQELAAAVEQGASKANESFLSKLVSAVNGDAQLRAANEKLSTDLAAAQAKITELSQAASDLVTAKQSIATLTAERDALKATIADPKGEIAKLASAKALEIASSQGTAALEIKGADATHGKAENTKTRAEFAAMSAAEQMKFCKSGGKLTE